MDGELVVAADLRVRRWRWLRSQGLGVACGIATVALFAVGSVALTLTGDADSRAIAMDEIGGFFAPWSTVHLWFYLLLVVLAFYAFNTALCTWDSVSARWRAGIRQPTAYAAALIHVGFLVALGAHLVGGLWSAEIGQLIVGRSYADIGDGRLARLVDLTVERQADGSPKQVRATLEIRAMAGSVTSATIAYNEPLSSGFGADLLLLVRPLSAPDDERGAAVLLRHRHAPGNALGLVAALLMTLGVAGMWRRWMWETPR